MDPDVDRRYRGSAEAEKYGNIQEFCASEDAPMTKENLEFGGKYYEEALNDRIVEQKNGLEDGKRQGTSSVSHSHLFHACGLCAPPRSSRRSVR